MKLKTIIAASAIAFGLAAIPGLAQEAAIAAMQKYLMFLDYKSGIFDPQQIDQTVFAIALFADTRDAGKFEEAAI